MEKEYEKPMAEKVEFRYCDQVVAESSNSHVLSQNCVLPGRKAESNKNCGK